MAYLEQDIHNQNIEHILQRIYNTVKHSLQFWNSLDGLQWSQHSQHSKRFYGAKILAGWTSTETRIFLTNLIIKRYGTGKVQGFVISFPILCLVNIKWNLIYNWTIINLGILFILLGWLANRVIFGVLSSQSAKWMPMPYLISPTQRRIY